jgi:DNA polymerase sigma
MILASIIKNGEDKGITKSLIDFFSFYSEQFQPEVMGITLTEPW